MRVASFVDEVQSTQDRRSALYQSYDDAINRFKTSKDVNAFVASRKKVDVDYRQLTTQIQTLQQQLKTEGTDISEKVIQGSHRCWNPGKVLEFEMKNSRP